MYGTSPRTAIIVRRCLAAGVCLWLSQVVAARPHWSAFIHEASRHGFRLGNAAKPFGWSTAVADFNTDGTPDVAVADRVVGRGGAYGYRIEFSISGEPQRQLTFESSEQAVTITVSDVDRDQDLDLVVGAPLSGRTLAVWLNDGQGHFTPADLRRLPSKLTDQKTFDAPDSPAHRGAVNVATRRTDDGVGTKGAGLPTASVARLMRADRTRHLSILSTPLLRPRAPPASTPQST